MLFAEAEKASVCCGGKAMPVVEGADLRNVVRAWMEQFVGYAPHAENVALVWGYLVHCAKMDVGACGSGAYGGVMRW